MTASRPLLVGTRGSELARRQTEEVLTALRAHHPQHTFQARPISTSGDRRRAAPLASLGRGVFVKELEAALLAREVDMAVHSLKDLPTDTAPGLSIAAVGPRGDPRDVLISKIGQGLMALPPGARVGTSSPRRACQVRAARPDLEVVNLRGNVRTRLRKLEAMGYDAIIVAAAGLERLGLQARVTEFLDPHLFVPAPGQGALAVEVRDEDKALRRLLAVVDHGPTRAATTAERSFLEALGGGCAVPMAAHGEVNGNILTLWGMIATEDGRQVFRDLVAGSVPEATALGRHLAQRLLELGAVQLVEGARS